jgi:acyl dehydratase
MPTQSLEEMKSHVGETFSLVERMPVEAGKIAEFAEAIGDDDPVFVDSTGEAAAERGFEDVPIPTTFTMTKGFWTARQDTEGRPDLGFVDERIVHGEQSFEIERRPVAGDVLRGEGELVDVFEREGSGGTMTFAVWETRLYDQNDELCVTERSTVIEVPA